MRAAAISRHRCGINYDGTLFEVFERGFDEIELRENVCLKGAQELAAGKFGDVFLGMLFSSIIHEDIQPSELTCRFIDESAAGGFFADVTGKQETPAVLCLDQPLCF